MKRSTERFLTTHTGSLPRPDDLIRTMFAKQEGVPAYVVFHDATLRQIAVERPATLAAVGSISGIGENKLRKYGQQVLDALAE